MARFLWVLTGIAWATSSLILLADPKYWDSVTVLDWSAVWTYSAAWLLFAPSVILLGRLASSRMVDVVAVVTVGAALVTSGSNLFEDGLGVAAAGTVYVVGVVTAWLALVPLTVALWRAAAPRLALLTLCLFGGLLFTAAGGGLIILAAFGALAIEPTWFARGPSADQSESEPTRGTVRS